MNPRHLLLHPSAFKFRLFIVPLFALSLLLPACSSDPRKGYAFSSTYSKQVRTIQVPIFNNTTSEPGIEIMLTEAIIKQLESKGWTVRQSAAADTTLSGTLTGSELRRLSLESRTGLIQELALTLTLDFEWRDNRTDKVLASRRSFSASDTFAPTKSPTSAGEPIEAGRFSAIDRIAKDLVGELQSKW